MHRKRCSILTICRQAKLSPGLTCVMLLAAEGLTQEEMAAMLGLSGTAVRFRIMRARKRILTTIQERARHEELGELLSEVLG